jgi:hypothetical protein
MVTHLVIMDNPETLVTLGTQDTGRRQTKQKRTTQETKEMSNTHPLKNRVEPIVDLPQLYGWKIYFVIKMAVLYIEVKYSIYSNIIQS